MISIATTIALLGAVAHQIAAISVQGDRGDKFVPGSGYGCERHCSGGDKNIILEATVKQYPIKGIENAYYRNGTQIGHQIDLLTRTFIDGCVNGTDPITNASCDVIEEGYDNERSILGPTITIKPGQTLMVRVINNIHQSLLADTSASTEKGRFTAEQVAEQNDMMEKFGTQYGYYMYGPQPKNNGTHMEDYVIPDIENLPGYDVSFDTTNIHLHGLNVVPHLFYPQGTTDPEADWVSIQPGEGTNRCMCYNFTLPAAHSEGTYWWHVHRHGSAAMQGYGGMVGFLQVEGGLDSQLRDLNITADVPIAMWGLPVEETEISNTENPNTTVATIGTFMDNKADANMQMLVNNEYQPTYSQVEGEIVRYRLLCAAVENMCAFEVLNELNDTVPIYNIASDGMAFDKAYEKSMLVLASGMREDILLRFDAAGRYKVVQRGMANVRYFNSGDEDHTWMYINVTETDVGANADEDDIASDNEQLNITAISFNQSQPEIAPITADEITAMQLVNFGTNAIANVVPAPLYQINGQSFNISKITYNIPIKQSQVWQIINTDNAVHPFHLHVVPFQVLASHTGWNAYDMLNNTEEVANVQPYNEYVQTAAMNPDSRWRDTVIIPAYGSVTIRIRFTEELDAKFRGKTVFHCHFLAHEDTGMMSNIMLT